MKSFLAYVGGKSLLADRIIKKIPSDHECYCEVFAGAAWLLFKKEPSKVEIINDINSELITLYRCVQNHVDELVRYMRWLLISRDEWDRLRKVKPETLTDIQRAVRFYFLLKNSFSSKLDFSSFRVAATGRPTFNFLRLEEQFAEAHLRLSGVYIENKPYQYIIERFDKPATFFYIDPPYYDCEDCYGKGIFSKADFETLNDLLKAVKGRFIMSINDTKEIRRIFRGFEIEPVKTTYSLAAKGVSTAKELLVRNY
jgi:DNA adenine methylase